MSDDGQHPEIRAANKPDKTIGALQKESIEQIGKQEDEDYRISPSDFPRATNKAAPLANLLDTDNLNNIATRYEKYDAEAIGYQSKFKHCSSRATRALLLTGILGAVQPLLPMGSLLAWLCGGIALFSGAYAMFELYIVQNQKLLSKWMTHRAKAETERLGYFQTAVTIIKQHAPKDLRLQVQFCEFFRRYQTGIQLRYYHRRALRHRADANRTAIISAVGAVTVWLGAGLAGLIGNFEGSVQLASLGCIGTAISLYASRKAEMTQDERNSERFNRTWETLSKLDGFHGDVIAKLPPEGNTAIIETYVNAIQNVLSLEHRQWLENTEEMGSAIQSLVELHKS